MAGQRSEAPRLRVYEGLSHCGRDGRLVPRAGGPHYLPGHLWDPIQAVGRIEETPRRKPNQGGPTGPPPATTGSTIGVTFQCRGNPTMYPGRTDAPPSPRNGGLRPGTQCGRHPEPDLARTGATLSRWYGRRQPPGSESLEFSHPGVRRRTGFSTRTVGNRVRPFRSLSHRTRPPECTSSPTREPSSTPGDPRFLGGTLPGTLRTTWETTQTSRERHVPMRSQNLPPARSSLHEVWCLCTRRKHVHRGKREKWISLFCPKNLRPPRVSPSGSAPRCCPTRIPPSLQRIRIILNTRICHEIIR